MSAMAKKLKLTAEELKPVATGLGNCIATDRITVEGYVVRFMYREDPINAADSGWRFLSGFESDAYMEEPSNQGMYDVNFIANCDPSIVEHLGAPIGSAFEKTEGKTSFEALTDWEPDED
jgi:hypothetical protein